MSTATLAGRPEQMFNMPKQRTRYGIGEWFGYSFPNIDKEKRKELAIHTIAGDKNLPCRFMNSLVPNATCPKAGGVCTIRKYAEDENKLVATADHQLVTLCPTRFMEDNEVLSYIGKVLLNTEKPVLVKEVAFLEKLKTGAVEETQEQNPETKAEEDEAKKAGRIDWVLVDPQNIENWCAVETQAVYFSGQKMEHEFELYRTQGDLVFPSQTRRPDYRSSGPKRLAPQLLVKVPELRSWGKKTAVVIDKFFYDNMSDLPVVSIKGGKPEDLLKTSEVIWFIVDYHPETGKLKTMKHLYTKLSDSITALNATRPISITDFEGLLKKHVEDKTKIGTKVFKL